MYVTWVAHRVRAQHKPRAAQFFHVTTSVSIDGFRPLLWQFQCGRDRLDELVDRVPLDGVIVTDLKIRQASVDKSHLHLPDTLERGKSRTVQHESAAFVRASQHVRLNAFVTRGYL